MRILILLVVLLGGGSAVAGEWDNPREAKAAFEAGKVAYNAAKYADAAGYFAKSFKLSGNADLLFNVAQAFRLAGQDAQAIGAYKAFLRDVPSSPNRTVAENHLQLLQINTLKAPSKAELERARALREFAPADEVHELTPASEVFRSVAVAPKPVPEPVRTIPQWVPWAGAGATTVFGLSAVAAYVSAQSRLLGLETTCGRGGTCSDEQVASVTGRLRTANVLWVLAGLTAVGTGVVVVVDYQEQQQSVSIAGGF